MGETSSRPRSGRKSAGLLLYRHGGRGSLEVLLVHPGGPFWAKKDDGAWSIPKGEISAGEDALAAARREFAEETGHAPHGCFVDLGTLKQPGGKVVHAWALESDFDPGTLVSGTFEMEWPRESGRRASFPEVDRAAWFDVPTARRKLLKGQIGFLERLIATLGSVAHCPRAALEEPGIRPRGAGTGWPPRPARDRPRPGVEGRDRHPGPRLAGASSGTLSGARTA